MSMKIVKSSCCNFLLGAELKEKGKCLARPVSLSAMTIPTGSFGQKRSESTMIRSTAPSCGSKARRSVLFAGIGCLPHKIITNTGGYSIRITNIFLLVTSGHFVGEMASTSSCQPRVIIQIKSFAELQFLLDDQFSADSTCKRCGTIENVDLVLSNTPHYLTIVLNWASGRQSQDTHSEVLAGITSPLEADSATINYIVASMICYADERYACCAGDEGNWLIYNSETIEICYADERCICFAGDEANWLIYNSETIKICYADERYVYFVGGEGNWLIYNCETIKIKSFAELPFVLDDQYSLEHCGSGTIENVDLFLSDMPHCFTIVLNWASGSESLDAFSEVLAGITCPLEDEFFCRRDRSATKYIVASMICYADERYACFAGDEGNWMIYNSETIEICYADERYVCCARDEGHWLINDSGTVETVDTWEHLLESFKDCKLQPEVLFFEVIK